MINAKQAQQIMLNSNKHHEDVMNKIGEEIKKGAEQGHKMMVHSFSPDYSAGAKQRIIEDLVLFGYKTVGGSTGQTVEIFWS